MADLTPEQKKLLDEASLIVCAANHSLKTLEGCMEHYMFIKSNDSDYTHDDMGGDFYCIRRALWLTCEFIRANGFNMEPLE